MYRRTTTLYEFKDIRPYCEYVSLFLPRKPKPKHSSTLQPVGFFCSAVCSHSTQQYILTSTYVLQSMWGNIPLRDGLGQQPIRDNTRHSQLVSSKRLTVMLPLRDYIACASPASLLAVHIAAHGEKTSLDYQAMTNITVIIYIGLFLSSNFLV